MKHYLPYAFHRIATYNKVIFLVAILIVLGSIMTIASFKLKEPTFKQKPPSTPPAKELKLPNDFTVQDKVGQLLIVGVTSEATALDLERQYQIGGFLLRPNSDLYDPRATTAIRQAGQLPPLLAVDEEGGQIARIPGGNFSQYSAKYMGTLSDTEVTQLGKEMGNAVVEIGANVDFAPVVDIDDGQNAAISQLGRAFSSDPVIVTKKAAAFAEGLRTVHVIPSFKHFPGLGHATGPTGGNTDTGPATTPPLSALQQSDLIPYATLLQADPLTLVMVGNQIVPGLTDNLPASLSRSTYGLLRTRFGYRQVIITDELLLAKAVSNIEPDPAATVVAAIQAGADMPLINAPDESTVGTIIHGVVTAIETGQISSQQVDDSIQRVLQLKQSLHEIDNN